MFLFRAGRYLEELKKFRPDILAACEQAMRGVDPDLDFIRVDEEPSSPVRKSPLTTR